MCAWVSVWSSLYFAREGVAFDSTIQSWGREQSSFCLYFGKLRRKRSYIFFPRMQWGKQSNIVALVFAVGTLISLLAACVNSQEFTSQVFNQTTIINAYSGRPVIFIGCTFRAELRVRFNSASVLYMDNCDVIGQLQFENAAYNGACVRIRSSRFRLGISWSTFEARDAGTLVEIVDSYMDSVTGGTISDGAIVRFASCTFESALGPNLALITVSTSGILVVRGSRMVGQCGFCENARRVVSRSQGKIIFFNNTMSSSSQNCLFLNSRFEVGGTFILNQNALFGSCFPGDGANFDEYCNYVNSLLRSLTCTGCYDKIFCDQRVFRAPPTSVCAPTQCSLANSVIDETPTSCRSRFTSSTSLPYSPTIHGVSTTSNLTATLSSASSRSHANSATCSVATASASSRSSTYEKPSTRSIPFSITPTRHHPSSPIRGTLVSVMGADLSEGAARAIVTSSALSAGVASIMGSAGAAGAATRIGFVAVAAECEFDDANIDPSPMQYPWPGLGTSGLQSHALGLTSCAIMSLALQCLVLLLPSLSRRGMKLLSAVDALCHQYFAPSVAFGALLVIRHSTLLWEVTVAVGSFVVFVVALAFRMYVVLRRVPQELRFDRRASGSRGTIKSHWEGTPSMFAYASYFDSCRDGNCAVVRLVYFVECGCSVAMGCAAGWRPSSHSDCHYVASVMVVIATILLIYLCVFRPYALRRELFLSIGFAGAQFVQAVTSLFASYQDSTAIEILGKVTLIQCGGLFAQLLLEVAWTSATSMRRQHTHQSQNTGDATTSILDVPLIAVGTGASNPLTHKWSQPS